MGWVVADVVRIAENGPGCDQTGGAQEEQNPEDLDRNGSSSRQLDLTPGLIAGDIPFEVRLEPLSGCQPPKDPVHSDPAMERKPAGIKTTDHRTISTKLRRVAGVDFLLIHEALQFRYEFIRLEGR